MLERQLWRLRGSKNNMVTLSTISRVTKNARATRVGRGGKRGTFSGRGTKGQKARSGRKMRPELRDIIKKIPKLRGYRVRIYRTKPITVTIKDLERVFVAGDEVTFKTLVEKKLVHARRADAQGIKVLGGGELTKALHVKDVSVSAGVRATITKAGGTVTEVIAVKATPSKTAKTSPKKVGVKKAPAKKEKKDVKKK